MKWWRSLSFIHESRLLVCFHCYGVLKPIIKFVTLISQWLVSINQHSMFLIVVPLQLQLTEIWWLLRYFKTSFSCRVWNKSTPTPRKSSYFDQILQLKVEFWKRSFCSESSYTVKIVWIHYAVEQYALKLKTVWWKCLIQGLKLHCP